MANPKIDAAYVEMLEAKLKLAESKLTSNAQFSVEHIKGTSKKGYTFDGLSISGPTWGFVPLRLAAPMLANVDACKAALQAPAKVKEAK